MSDQSHAPLSHKSFLLLKTCKMLLLEEDIPSYLRSSPYWQVLLNGGPFSESGIEIPDGCLKADLVLSTEKDLTELLSTLRFWLLPELLYESIELVRFAFCPAHKVHFVNSAEEFRDAFPLVVEIAEIVCHESQKRVEAAVHYGHMHVVQYLVEQVNEPVTVEAGVVASDQGKLDHLKYLHSRGLELTIPICGAACKSGHLDCVKYLMDSKAEKSSYFASNCAAFGHFECAKYAVQNTSNGTGSTNGTINTHSIYLAFKHAATTGQVECLKQMMVEWKDPRYHETMMVQAAGCGQMIVLLLATQSGVSATNTPLALEEAARAGHMECVRYLHELGCPLTSEALEGAAECGNAEIFGFLIERNCPTELFVCAALALHGRLELLQYAHEHGCPWDERTCAAAAESGCLACLKYAREQGCPWRVDHGEHITQPSVPVVFIGGGFTSFNDAGDLAMVEMGTEDEAAFLEEWGSEDEEGCPHIAVSAASAPSVDCLQYLMSQGVALHKECGRYATRACCVETMQLLHAHGVNWGAKDCAAVTAAGSVECLQFLHEIGTSWDASTCRRASNSRSLECLKYAHENGCPWDAQTCKKAGSRECYEYAVAHGCPGAELSRYFKSG